MDYDEEMVNIHSELMHLRLTQKTQAVRTQTQGNTQHAALRTVNRSIKVHTTLTTCIYTSPTRPQSPASTHLLLFISSSSHTSSSLSYASATLPIFTTCLLLLRVCMRVVLLCVCCVVSYCLFLKSDAWRYKICT